MSGGTMLLSFNGTEENGQFLGDQLVSLKAAWLFVQNERPDRVLISMSPHNRLHTYWRKFLEVTKADVVYDTWNPGDWPTRWEHWDRWRHDRHIEGRKFDLYRELYRRIDGGERQRKLCGGENGLNRRNIFEYFVAGQENYRLGEPIRPTDGTASFGSDLMHWTRGRPDRGVYIAPYAKCQGNDVFTMYPDGFWPRVVHRVVDAGVSVTVGYNGEFCEELVGHPLYVKYYGPDFDQLRDELCRHRLVACGNTGVGWLAAACGIPLLAMQHVGSQMPDYHYDKCGVASLLECVREPDPDYVARRIVEEVQRVTVATTGCYDVLHAGHVQHLEESRGLGTRLVVFLNSDASVKRRKGDARPVNAQGDRARVLAALRCVDEVRVFDGDTAEPEIAALRPDVLTNGRGYELDQVVGREAVESWGGRVHLTCRGEQPTAHLSTTRTLAAMPPVPLHPVGGLVDQWRVVSEAAQFSVNPKEKLQLLADQFRSVLDLPGSAADVGAYRGACSYVMRRLAPRKRLHLFDTWAGNPHDDDLCHHKRGEWPASLMECRNLVGESPQTHYHEGVFPETAEGINGEQFSFVVVDGDTYQTTLAAIEFFWPRMVAGGKMLFDDHLWPACSGVDKALNERFGDNERVAFPNQFTCVVTKS